MIRMIYSNDPMARIPTTKPYITSNIKKFKLAIRSFFQKIHHEICANGWHFPHLSTQNSQPPLASPGSSHFDGHQLPRFFTTTFFFPPFPGNTLKLHLFCPKKMHFFFLPEVNLPSAVFFLGVPTKIIWKNSSPFSLPWFLGENSVDFQMWNNKDQTSTRKYQNLQENLLVSSKCWLHPKQVELTLSYFGQLQLPYQCLLSTQPA